MCINKINCIFVGYVQNPPAIKIHPRSKSTRLKSTRSKSDRVKIHPIKINPVQNPPDQNQPGSKSTRVKIHPIKINLSSFFLKQKLIPNEFCNIEKNYMFKIGIKKSKYLRKK